MPGALTLPFSLYFGLLGTISLFSVLLLAACIRIAPAVHRPNDYASCPPGPDMRPPGLLPPSTLPPALHSPILCHTHVPLTCSVFFFLHAVTNFSPTNNRLAQPQLIFPSLFRGCGKLHLLFPPESLSFRVAAPPPPQSPLILNVVWNTLHHAKGGLAQGRVLLSHCHCPLKSD